MDELLHLVPFQCSASGRSALPSLKYPTAQTFLGDSTLTPVRTVSALPGDGTPPAPLTETHLGEGLVVS